MSKAKNLLDKRLEEKQKIHDELFNKTKKEIDGILNDEKTFLENYLVDTHIGEKYHDLIDSKDKLNSKHKSNFNKTYHSIDVELYKLNRKIDNKVRYVNHEINNKKEKLF